MVLSPPRQEASKTGGNGELSDFFEAAHVVNDGRATAAGRGPSGRWLPGVWASGAVLKRLDGGKTQRRPQGRRGWAAVAAADHLVIGGVVAGPLSKTQGVEGRPAAWALGKRRLPVAITLFRGSSLMSAR